ncbi:aldo/keto reductase [Plantibacter sp. Leaf171]|uniref:aldo/keto reductase n=1 Tax=unclassified Plantibacter TaxID=2624265 RepID=UPI0006FEAA9C|nr:MULTISPECIES: aldo/keto reductase [unclassified Plantibacter]KQM16177.1 aldo/keto reductase [Plantibacter sp. Leaf1]KQR59313.1 aldo/keto reductase [Plantibacter sp. Leaf171]
MPELLVPRLAYGAANLGNLYRELGDDEAWAILDTAWEHGVRFYDTAPHYGLGLSERRLGAFLRTKPRDEYVLSTKVGRLLVPNPDGAGTLDTDNDFVVPATLRREWDASESGVRRSLDESLERLGIDHVDVLYLHDPERNDPESGIAEGIPALAALRDEGLVGAVGIGSMDVEALLAAVRTGLTDLIMIAGRFTLAEQPAAAEVLPACLDHGVGVVAASVFNSGLLARSVPDPDGRYEYGAVPSEVFDRAVAIAEVCRRFDVELPAAALQFPLRHPAVRTVAVGASRPEQMVQNIERFEAPIPETFWAELQASGLLG